MILSDTGLTLNKSIEWLKKYEPTKNYINEVKTACLWKKKSSSFEPDFCSVKLRFRPMDCSANRTLRGDYLWKK